MVWNASGAQADGAYQEQQPERKAKTDGESLTGYVQWQNGRYVLVDDKTLAAIANPERDGFRAEGFAKPLRIDYVFASRSTRAARPLVKVPSIETVSHAGGCQKLRVT
jgi:hypothetical protein